MKLKYIILCFLHLLTLNKDLSFISIRNKGNNDDSSLFSRNEEMTCNKEYARYITFDFGSEVVSSEKTFTTFITHEFDTTPLVSCIGSISGVFSVLDNFTIKANFSFPSFGEGESLIEFSANEKTIKRNIFSVPFSDKKWAVSILSMCSAKYLSNTFSDQDLFDNNTTNTNDFTIEQGFVTDPCAIGNGCIKGRIGWRYIENVSTIYPLSGAKVRLTFSNSWGHVDGYADEMGNYNLCFNNMWNASTKFIVTLHVYWENDLIKIVRSDDSVYEYAKIVYEGGGSDVARDVDCIFSIDKEDDYGEASSLYSIANTYAFRAKSLNNNKNFLQCNFRYPESNGFDYSPSTHTVRVNCLQDYSGRPYSYEAWDVIGHEYGHHLQTAFGFSANAGGSHSSSHSDIEDKFTKPNISDADAKDEGCRLAWNESWPTFFETVAQKSTQSFFFDIYNRDGFPRPIGDNNYSSVGCNLEYSLDRNDILKGEGCERTIMCFLFKLWESNNLASYDSISISEEKLWNLVINSKPTKLYEFISALSSELHIEDLSKLGKLLAGFKLSPSKLTILSTEANYASLPTFSWNGNGYGFVVDSKFKHFENNIFTFNCYDLSKTLLFSESGLSSSYYQLSELQWNKVLGASGDFYYVSVNGYSLLGGMTGPYCSELIALEKPKIPIIQPDLMHISSKRYFE